jgi:co-chaperonin GroES (HSP10)
MTGKFTPAKGKLLVRRTPKKTEHGVILLPGTSMEIPADGIVLAVGDGVEPQYLGSHVFYSVHTDEEIVLEDEHLFLVRAEHLKGYCPTASGTILDTSPQII